MLRKETPRPSAWNHSSAGDRVDQAAQDVAAQGHTNEGAAAVGSVDHRGFTGQAATIYAVCKRAHTEAFNSEASSVAWACQAFQAVFGKRVSTNNARHAFLSALDVSK